MSSTPHSDPSLRENATPSPESPALFWAGLIRDAALSVQGRAGVLLARTAGQSDWRCIAQWPAEGHDTFHLVSALRQPHWPGELLAAGGRMCVPLPKDPSSTVLGTMADLPQQAGQVLCLVATSPVDASGKEALLDRLALVLARAPLFQLELVLNRARQDVTRFATILDLLALLKNQDRFMATAMTLTNELASRLHADRVSIGWVQKGYIHVKVISHVEQFERKMDAVHLLETAMEEALEQDCEICWPAPDDAPAVTRDHQHYVEAQSLGHIFSLPIRDAEKNPVAVITLERKTAPFDIQAIEWMRVCADQVAPLLISLEERDAWVGKRAWRRLRKQAGKWVGVEHTGTKLIALAAVLAVAFLILGRWPHRIKANFSLRADEAMILPAPFDGYLAELHAEKGDLVDEGADLAALDVRELLIEQTAAAADFERYTREAEKARAQRDLAGMRMAEALRQQAEARLALVGHRLDLARVRAPFAGAVIEGDLRERIGMPLQQGDLLFKVARLTSLTVDAEIDERDIDYVSANDRVRLVFASRPAHGYAARIERIDPMAQSIDGRNVFLARCVIEDDIEPWWRPGMSGVARIHAGTRTPLWLLTRRTMDYLLLHWGW